MSTLAWIIVSGLAMAVIAMVGALTSFLKPEVLERLLLPLVAFAAGSLIGGAVFHMLPAAMAAGIAPLGIGIAIAGGFTAFFLMELLLHWHHCRQEEQPTTRPLTYLILIGDGLHNFLGGLAIGGTFLIDVRLGIMSWLAAAAHEIPQELGDFAVLVHGGWPPRKALLFNVLSGLTFLAGGLLTYVLSRQIEVSWLIPVAAGNFIYIAAADLIPEINRQQANRATFDHVLAFLAGLALLLAARVLLPE